MTISRWSAPDFASGCAGDVRFFSDVLQHVLFAQHPGLHAFSLATFERMHVRAESGIAATGSAIATMSDMTILLMMCSPHNMWDGRRLVFCIAIDQ
jgi:hypothetical protein